MVIGWWHWIEQAWKGRNVFMVTLVWGTHAGRIQQHQDKYPRQSNFSFALYGQLWMYDMELWADLGYEASRIL